MNPRRLYRSRSDRQLAGVAGGMAEYLEVDPTVVRLLWILSIFLGGITILLYIIMAFIVPLEPLGGPAGGPADPGRSGDPAADVGAEGGAIAGWTPPGSPPASGAAAYGTATYGGPAYGAQPAGAPRDRRGGLYMGIGLVVFGAIALVETIVPGWSGSGQLWAALVVALGVALVVGATRRKAVPS